MECEVCEVRYLTTTIVRDFLTCPEKGRLLHIEKLRKPGVKGVLLFGTGLHLGIESYYKKGVLPWDVFEVFWDEAVRVINSSGVDYDGEEDFEETKRVGKMLLKRWIEKEETPDPEFVFAVEKEFRIEIEGIPFYGTIDYIGEGGEVLIDWKTSSYRYNNLRADYDLQLTAYSYVLGEMMGRIPEKVGFGVFVKKKDPEVQYIWGRQRRRDDFENFKKIVKKVYFDILRGEFFRHPGLHCQWCDFLPLCNGEVDKSFYVKRDSGYYEKYEGKEE